MFRILLFSIISLVFSITKTAAQIDTTNQGKEFWVGYGHHQLMETGTNDMDMILYLCTSSQSAQVKVSIYGIGNPIVPVTTWERTYTIAPYTVISTGTTPSDGLVITGAGSFGPMPKSGGFDCRLYSGPPTPPIGGGSSSVGFFTKKGILITSDVPIVAYAHIYASASSGATMLLPTEAWGNAYVSINSKQNYDSNSFNWLYVIAKENNTVLQITPTVLTRNQNQSGQLPWVTKTILLNKGEIYQLLGANDVANADGVGGTSVTGKELTGTKIISIANSNGITNPIAVFSGSSRTLNPANCGTGGGDNDIQQMFPVNMWGKKYLTTPFSTSANDTSFGTSVYKIIVPDPTTIVTVNGTVLAGMQAGNIYKYESNTPDYIEANKPISVAQLMVGGSCMPALGDPDIVPLTPLEQGIKSSISYRTSISNITVSYLSLVVPTIALPSLLIDNSNSFYYVSNHPNKSNYSIVIKRWTGTSGVNGTNKGQIVVSCDSAFTGITYGLGSVESYLYNLGGSFKVINQEVLNIVNTALPSTIAQFTATPKNNNVLLNWSTINEVNVAKYSIEKSFNGNEFSFLSSNIALNLPVSKYEFVDYAVPNKAIYYRLKIVDNDGKFSYSKTLLVKPNSNQLLQVTASPNPFKSELKITIQSEKVTDAFIQLKDLSGKTIYSQQKVLKQGTNNVIWNHLAELQQGVYLLTLISNNEVQTIKIVK
jgi:hypothetical protein